MNFGPWNTSKKIWNSIVIPIPKVIWECGGSFPHILSHFWEHEMWFLGFIFSPHFRKPLPWSQAQG
jgi:hypothetical protein